MDSPTWIVGGQFAVVGSQLPIKLSAAVRTSRINPSTTLTLVP